MAVDDGALLESGAPVGPAGSPLDWDQILAARPRRRLVGHRT